MAALGLKRAGKYKEAQESFDQAIESLIGLNANLARQLSDQALLDLLTFQGRLDTDRVLVLADIYREKAEISALQGSVEEGTFYSQRSLRLYLETALSKTESLGIELIQKIETLRKGLTSKDMPIETRLALLDYLDRLLATEDETLNEAGLAHQDLIDAQTAIDGPDLY
jgi:hypothetical protein